MQDHDHGFARRRAGAHHSHDFFGMVEVQGCSRFVEKHDRSVLVEHARAVDAGALAAGEGRDFPVKEVRDVAFSDDFREQLFVRAAPGVASEVDDFTAGEWHGQFLALHQDGAVAGQVGDGELGNGVLADPDVAATELMVARKRCEQCRLSSTIRADQRGDFSGLGDHGNIVEDAVTTQGDADIFGRNTQARVNFH